MEKQKPLLKKPRLIAGILLLLASLPSAAFGTEKGRLYPILEENVRDFGKQYRKIPEQRRYRLNEIVKYLEKCHKTGSPGRLLFIDTDQSALSLLVQVWAQTAAFYFGLESVTEVYSGALQPGPVSEDAIFALERAGYIVYRSGIEGTTLYKIKYSYNLEPLMAFSKPLDFRKNPRQDFMGVIVDSNADLNLSRVKGTPYRLALLYDDPSGYTGSDKVQEAFDHTCRQIALEMFYVFWRLKNQD